MLMVSNSVSSCLDEGRYALERVHARNILFPFSYLPPSHTFADGSSSLVISLEHDEVASREFIQGSVVTVDNSSSSKRVVIEFFHSENNCQHLFLN